MSRRTRGMTLVELSVVLALVGLTATLSVAGYQRLIGNQRASDTVRELLAATQVARQHAVTRKQMVRFVVEPITLDGRLRTVARWEQLPCDNTWGSGNCPTSACQANTCRSGCTCTAVGPDIVVPDEVVTDMDAARRLHGLCFQRGSGRPLAGNGLDCLSAPGSREVRVDMAGGQRSYLRLDGLTGVASLVDCAAAGTVCPALP